MPLTSKQQDYVAARIAGSGPSEAYRIAYDASKMSVASVAKEANTLDRHPVIAPMLTQAVQVVTERAQATAIDLLNRLWDIGSSDEKDRVAALSAMRSFYPEFREAQSTQQVNIQIVAESRLSGRVVPE